MIERMKYINIMGRIEDIDYAIQNYMSVYEIHLENSIKVLSDTQDLSPYNTTNPYALPLSKAEKIMSVLDVKSAPDVYAHMSNERALLIINQASDFYQSREERLLSLSEEKQRLCALQGSLKPYVGLNFDLSRLEKFEFIKFRFGKMPVSSFKQFEEFLYDDRELLFVEGSRDEESVWGLYFVPSALASKIDSVFSSLHFKRIRLSYEIDGFRLNGLPSDVYEEISQRIDSIQNEIESIYSMQFDNELFDKSELISAYAVINRLYENGEVARYAARTKKNFYIFVGWISEEDGMRLIQATENDERVVIIIDEKKNAYENSLSRYAEHDNRPPTKMSNMAVFKPFEFFIRMYGVPSYDELDPTPLIALVYTLLFGLMFGDIGQGAVIALIGLYVEKRKKLALGSVMKIIGLSSVLFGFLYGSVFGFEIFAHPFYSPSQNVMTSLICGIVLGVILVFTVISANIVNACRQRDISKFLGPNGLPGLLFYAAVIAVILMIVTEQTKAAQTAVIIFAVIPLIIIAFHEPLINFVKRKKNNMKSESEGVALFILETVIGVFEVLLSYFSNTLSFVRVGAFALSHAGMMQVVFLLSGEAAGSRNYIVIILGNILVICLEGLIVGIQSLRLVFYEMFSRFYDGGGKEFTSHRNKK